MSFNVAPGRIVPLHRLSSQPCTPPIGHRNNYVPQTGVWFVVKHEISINTICKKPHLLISEKLKNDNVLLYIHSKDILLCLVAF